MAGFYQVNGAQVSAVIVAIVVGMVFETCVFGRSTPLAALPALIAGYLALRIYPFIAAVNHWLSSAGVLQGLFLFFAVVCGVAVSWLVWFFWPEIENALSRRRPFARKAARTPVKKKGILSKPTGKYVGGFQVCKVTGALYKGVPQKKIAFDILVHGRFKATVDHDPIGSWMTHDFVTAQRYCDNFGAIVEYKANSCGFLDLDEAYVYPVLNAVKGKYYYYPKNLVPVRVLDPKGKIIITKSEVGQILGRIGG